MSETAGEVLPQEIESAAAEGTPTMAAREASGEAGGTEKSPLVRMFSLPKDAPRERIEELLDAHLTAGYADALEAYRVLVLHDPASIDQGDADCE
jgi:hypothetical protein